MRGSCVAAGPPPLNGQSGQVQSHSARERGSSLPRLPVAFPRVCRARSEPVPHPFVRHSLGVSRRTTTLEARCGHVVATANFTLVALY